MARRPISQSNRKTLKTTRNRQMGKVNHRKANRSKILQMARRAAIVTATAALTGRIADITAPTKTPPIISVRSAAKVSGKHHGAFIATAFSHYHPFIVPLSMTLRSKSDGQLFSRKFLTKTRSISNILSCVCTTWPVPKVCCLG